MQVIVRYLFIVLIVISGAMGLRLALDKPWQKTKQPSELTEADIAISQIPLEWQPANEPMKTTHLKDWRGKHIVLLFGYQQCPDVCPTSLSFIARELKALGQLATNVQTIFVSVDPSHDDAKGLATYAKAFDPSFIGVTGTDAALRNMTNNIGVYFKENTPNNQMGGDHLERLAHSATLFILDDYGHLRETLSPPFEPGALKAILNKLAKDSPSAH